MCLKKFSTGPSFALAAATLNVLQRVVSDLRVLHMYIHDPTNALSVQ